MFNFVIGFVAGCLVCAFVPKVYEFAVTGGNYVVYVGQKGVALFKSKAE